MPNYVAFHSQKAHVFVRKLTAICVTFLQVSVPLLTDIKVATPGGSCRRGVTFEQQQALASRGQLVVGV